MTAEPNNQTDIDDDFFNAVARELRRHPAGVSEYDLISALREQGYFSFMSPSPVPHHELFCAHFLLFHSLYRLRDQARAAAEADLDIHVLNIKWRPYQAASQAMDRPDPLRAYYLDLTNLRDTTAHDVEELMASFWRRVEGRQPRVEALARLGLSDPVDDATIKQAYRRLVMAHHPDRGGDTEQLQAINAALAVLL